MKAASQSPARTLCVMLLLATMMTGCVTSTNSRFSKEEDKQEALENYTRLATAYVSQGNFGRARGHARRALEIDPDSAKAHAVMGLIYEREGDSDLAEQSFRAAVDNDAGYTRGRVYYAAFLYNSGRFGEARDQFERATRDTAYENRESVFYNLGRSEEQLGNFAAAAKAFQRSVELSRGSGRSLLAAARSYVELGEYNRASRYYSQLDGMIKRSPQARHTPETLLIGIRIARYFGDDNRESSLAMLLRNEYPGSDEYLKYKALRSDEQ